MPPAGADDTSESFYDEFWSNGVWSGREPNADEQIRITVLDRLISHHGLGPRIVDLGCGRGVVTSALAHHGEITGIDVVAAGIERGNELFPTLDLRHTSMADLNKTNAGEFDLVVSTEVIEHVPHPAQASFIADISHALRPAGWLLMTTPRGELHDQWRAHVDKEQPTEAWLTEDALDGLLNAAGFTVVHRERTGVYPLTRWYVPLVVSPVRRLAARFDRLRRMIDRAGIYQVVLARQK